MGSPDHERVPVLFALFLHWRGLLVALWWTRLVLHLLCSSRKYQHSDLESSSPRQATATATGSVAEMPMMTLANSDELMGNRNIPVEVDRSFAEEGSWDRHS